MKLLLDGDILNNVILVWTVKRDARKDVWILIRVALLEQDEV